MANRYIDYDLGDNGNDGLSQLTPKKTGGGTTWNAGDRVAMQGGVEYQGTLTIGGSGTAAAPITLTNYGLGHWKIKRDATGGGGESGCAYATARSWLIVENGECYGATAFPHAGVSLQNCSHVTIRNLHLHHNEYGVRINNSGASPIESFEVSACVIEFNENTGITAVCGTSTGGTGAEVTITDCVVRNNGVSGSHYSLHLTTRIDTSGSGSGYDPTRTLYDVTVERCIFDRCPGYGVNVRFVKGLRFVGNVITGSGWPETNDTHSLWLGGVLDAVVFGNEIYGNFGFANSNQGSGLAIFVDQGGNGPTSGHDSKRVIVAGNYIHDQWQGPTTASPASAGIGVYRSTDVTIMGNVIVRCRNGITVRGATTMNSERVGIYNNTMVDITEAAVNINNYADTVTVQNNIAVRCGIGFFKESGAAAAVNVNRDFNCAFDCGMNWATGSLASMTADTSNLHDIEVDPLLDASLRLTEASPCRGAGRYIPGAKHFGGVRMSAISPDMGAHRFFESPETVTGRPMRVSVETVATRRVPPARAR